MNQGATWGKWDLHIHTPASYEWQGKRLRDAANAAERNALLLGVVEGINASGCAAVAVMDYWTFDGVVALREYLALPDAVSCAAQIFPGIELRMVSPGAFRLNMHVLLNPELSAEKLTAFKAHLKLALSGKPLSNDYLIDWAREHLSAERLTHFGTSKAVVASDDAVALTAACKAVEVTPESVIEALKLIGERDAILFVPFDTNDGINKIKFREHYAFPRELLAMEAVFEVANAATRDAFIGLKTEDNKTFYDEFQAAIKHPKLAVRGSDAHSTGAYGRFPGGNATWIKANPTFAGLLQACREPKNRSFVGPIPPKVDFVDKHPQLFIKGVRVRKVAGAPEPGVWFDGTDLPMNADLVALIGRKGSGKSALADVLGVLGDTPNGKYFSFLSPQRFRLPKDNKSSSFEAQLEWQQDTKDASWRNLSEGKSPASVQRVKYLPQRYFEELCNDHVKGDDTLLQDELREVIFSHIPLDEREGAGSLNELVGKRTEVIERQAARLRIALKSANARIIQLTEQVSADSQSRAREAVRLSLLGLQALQQKKPALRAVPVNDDAVSQGTAQRIAEINVEIVRLEGLQTAARTDLDALKARTRAIDDVLVRLAELETAFGASQADLSPKLEALGLAWSDIAKLEIQRASIEALLSTAKESIESRQAELDPGLEKSLPHQIAQLRLAASTEQAKLDGPMREYQESLNGARVWQVEWEAAVGSSEHDETFRGLWHRLRALPQLRQELAELRVSRRKVSTDILDTLHQRAKVLRDLFAPVQALVDEEPQISEVLGVQFSVKFSFDAFSSRLFDFIKRSAGSFVGNEESNALVTKFLTDNDLATNDGLVAFLDGVEEAIAFDIRGSGRRPVAPGSILKSDHTLAQLWDFLYSLEYADLSYGLMLGNVELERLSPGQRGALLLIFYLLVDRERIPIILDQPEENLDNETVYQLLVGVITRAKQHRQVVMVTHNANLAVACDAEQVIVCTMSRDGSNKISYDAGSIEELGLNRSVVDILEGTKPAFENRRRKYL